MPDSELQGLLEAAVDAILVIDHRGTILTFNPSAERIFGHAAADVIGRNVNVLMPEPYHSAHDDYLARYAQTGVPHIIGIGREIEAKRKDGSVFPASLSVGRIRGREPAQYVGFVRDITAQRESMASIRRERDRANSYLQLFPHVLLTLDPSNRITAVNEHGCVILEHGEHDLMGRDFLAVAVAVEDWPRVASAIDALRLAPTGEHVEFSGRLPEAPKRTIAWRCLRVEGGMLCAGEDVTDALQREIDERESQARLTNAARLATMGELTAGIAHELNQPLAAIANYSRAAQRFLARNEPDLDEAKLALEEVAAEALRAGEIIHRLRRLIDRQRHERRPTDVNELIADLRELTCADARAHQAQVHFDLQDPLPKVMVDPAELQHVLLNLTRNALEALASGPAVSREIRITTRRSEEGDVEIVVSDNGPGVSPDMVSRMFDPFSTSKVGGTGLGLAIGKSLIRSNGGRLDYVAAEPHGARFRVRLPANEDQAA